MEAYEALRSSVASASSRGESLQGLGAFLRRGMAAWMHLWRPAAPLSPPAASRSETRCLPPEVRRDVVSVLAAMVLSRAKEVGP